MIYSRLSTGIGMLIFFIKLSGLLISMLEKINLLRSTGLATLVLLIIGWAKIEGLLLKKNHPLRCWDCLSLLNWIEALTLSLLLKLSPRKLEP